MVLGEGRGEEAVSSLYLFSATAVQWEFSHRLASQGGIKANNKFRNRK